MNTDYVPEFPVEDVKVMRFDEAVEMIDFIVKRCMLLVEIYKDNRRQRVEIIKGRSNKSLEKNNREMWSILREIQEQKSNLEKLINYHFSPPFTSAYL